MAGERGAAKREPAQPDRWVGGGSCPIAALCWHRAALTSRHTCARWPHVAREQRPGAQDITSVTHTRQWLGARTERTW